MKTALSLLVSMESLSLLGLTLLGLIESACGAEFEPVSKDQERAWLNHVIPLPHEVAIPRKAMLDCADIRITLRPEATELEKSAAAELEDLFKRKTGSVPAGKGFEILLGIADKDGTLCGRAIEGVKALKDKPNRDQAYLIKPLGDNRLALTGLGGKGVYYAAVTLRALLEPAIRGNKAEVPLMTVTDWPDIEERGVWNSGTMVIEMAPFNKLNFSRAGSKLSLIKRDAPNHASVNTNEIAQARRRAVHHLPDIVHLNMLDHDRYQLFTAYPELKGKGQKACAGQYVAHKAKGFPEKENRAPCASNPILARILTEWLSDIAASGVPECGCWLTERPAQCECETCLKTGQFVLEGRAFVTAWKNVIQTYPDFRIRLFISTTTDERYDELLAGLPKEVKVERACALGLERRRHEPRDVFVNDLLDPYAAKGTWIATWDAPLSSNGKVDTPEFKTPHCSADRIRDFVQQMAARKYRGIYGMRGYTHPERINGFNINALAEWAWNLNGRTEREFAVAWATCQGYEAPEQVGDWAALMGPVEWDVYDSGYPECYAWGQAADMVKAKTKPVLGQGMFRYYATPDSFDAKLAVCDKALAIAASFKNPDLLNETKVIRSYIRMARAIYRIADAVSGADAAKPEVKKGLANDVAALNQAGAENVEALRTWRAAIGPEPWHDRLYAAIRGTEDTVREITQVAR